MPVKTTVECYMYDIDTPNESKISHNRGSWGETFNAACLNQKAHGDSELIEGLSASIHSCLGNKAPAR